MTTFVPVAAVLVAGLSLLLAIQLIRPTLPDLVLGLGPAYLLGTAAVSVTAITLLVAGTSLVLAFVAAAVLPTLGGVVVIARRKGTFNRHRGEPVPRAAAVALIVLLALAILGAAGALGHPVDGWDAWSIYERKALALLHADGLDPRFFANPSLAFMHADYPLLLPLLEAVEMKFGAAADGTGLVVLTWLVFVAYGWTVVFVAAREVHSAWPLVAGIALMVVPGGYGQALTGYADIPMAALLGAGVMFAASWLRSGRKAYLVTAAVLLAGTAAAKNEGLLGAIVVLLAATAFARTPLRRSHALIAAALVLATVLPWRLWLARHGIHGDVAFSDGIDPGYVVDRLERAGLAVSGLARDGFGSDWPLILPVALLLTAIGAFARGTRTLALFHLAAGLGFFAVLVWVYTVSRNDINWYLGTSAPRTVTAVILIEMSAIVHLAGGEPVAGARDGRETSPDREPHRP